MRVENWKGTHLNVDWVLVRQSDNGDSDGMFAYLIMENLDNYIRDRYQLLNPYNVAGWQAFKGNGYLIVLITTLDEQEAIKQICYIIEKVVGLLRTPV